MGAKRAANPRKRPRQARSQATVAAIVTAAARILVAKGYEGFTTNAVAEKAGVSVGSLYQYFPNKEALLAELMRRHVEEMERGIVAITDKAAGAPLEDVIRALIEDNVRAHLIAPELHHVLSDEVPSIGPMDWREGFTRRTTARIKHLLESRRREIAVRDIDLAVYIVMNTVEASVHDAGLYRPRDLKSGALADEITRMVVLYLTGVAPRRARLAAE